MPSITLLESIPTLYPDIVFEAGEEFSWNPEKKTITFVADDPLLDAHLLHELSHAELNHESYSRDVELIAMERDAWQHARSTLAPKYSVDIDSDTIQDDLDTYRDWLHARSTCPKCSSNGIQTGDFEYTCVFCRNIWRVNTAIGCALRRYNKKRAE
ncbi:MAG TPA: hypothetical protein VGE34_00025 [Candidatus Saccharimonadales bacterium]